MPEHDIPPPLAHPSAKRACVERSEPAKRKKQWTLEEDTLIVRYRGSGEKWVEISKRLRERSAMSCRLRYQNFLERRQHWDEADKNRLAVLYERYDIHSFGPTP